MNFKNINSILWKKVPSKNATCEEQEKFEFLKSVSFFENLSDRQLQELSNVIYHREYQTDEFVFELGQPGAALFFVQEGEVAIEIPQKTGDPIHLTNLSNGSFFGELALLDGSSRSASARAIKPTKCQCLFRKNLEKMAKTSPEIAYEIYRCLTLIIGERLKDTNELLNNINNVDTQLIKKDQQAS